MPEREKHVTSRDFVWIVLSIKCSGVIATFNSHTFATITPYCMAPLGHDVLTGGMQDVSTDGQKLVIESSTTTVPKCLSIHDSDLYHPPRSFSFRVVLYPSGILSSTSIFNSFPARTN